MTPFLALLPLLFENLFSLLFNWLFWVVIFIVGIQYKRMARISQQAFGFPEEPVWPTVLKVSFFGLIGGILGSFLLVIVGISVMEIGIGYLWATAIFLMFVQQRFLCFAYAGGLIALSKILFGFPEVSVPQVMALVAILHMIESLLIYASGAIDPIPVYVKRSQGQVVGGFNLQKFWPLPLVALLAWLQPAQEMVSQTIQMPDWWPLVKAEYLQGTGEPIYSLMPVVAALGYGDIAVSDTPRERTRRSACELALYSLVLLVLAVSASYLPQLAIIAALFGPLGHEFIIYLGQRREMKGQPVFVPSPEGIMVLDVLKRSWAHKAGIRSQDIILALNGQPIKRNHEIRERLLHAGEWLEIEYWSHRGQKRVHIRLKRRWDENLGVLPVPQGYENNYLEFSGSRSLFKVWWQKIFAKK